MIKLQYKHIAKKQVKIFSSFSSPIQKANQKKGFFITKRFQ